MSEWVGERELLLIASLCEVGSVGESVNVRCISTHSVAGRSPLCESVCESEGVSECVAECV